MKSVVARFFSKILNTIPILAAKIGTMLVLIFVLGMAAGYFISTAGMTPTLFLIPILAMFIMWYKLDEGVFILILLSLLVIFFPEFIDSLIVGIL